jgi:hypothetical protein
MARMLVCRLLTVLALSTLVANDAAAQFRRGMMGESVEINLFPAIPPA